jgi:TolB-like protein/DNA-binding winged helix-turn-helix (wHTH) protein/cytochrome c-type biogenesis protein CcmH/NrfG
MESRAVNIYEFGEFRLDAAKRLLWRLDGTPVPLTPRVFDTLLFMLENHDSVLDKERIMEAIWPDSIVEENNLAQAIWKLRQVFGETPGSHSYIVTVPGRGYRFVAEVKELTGSAAVVATQEPVATAASIPETVLEMAGDQVKEQYSPSAASKTFGADFTGKKAFRVAVAAIAIVGLAALLFVRLRSLPAGMRTPTSPAQTLSVPAPIPKKSVAVLPFDNFSDEKQNAYFAAGVQDEITSNLALIADLKVISRTSANLYKSGNPRNSREIGQQLGVAHLLEGNVQRIGNRLRVNAQLIKADTDTHVWAQTYNRDVTDLFAIQSEIAQAIAAQLAVHISPAVKRAIQRPPTTDLTAFDLYTRARSLSPPAFFSNAGKKDLLEAIDLLNQAVSRDPAFFQAYCQLAWVHDVLYFLGYDRTPARLAQAEAAIQAAFRLRPDAGEAHLARAENFYRGYLDYDNALTELKVARQTLPNDPRIFELMGLIQRRSGRWEESTRNLEHAVDLDPRNVFTLLAIADSYRDLRRYAEAASAYDRVLGITPDAVKTKAARALVELEWKANTRPLRQLVDSVQTTNPVAVADIADTWLLCALAERDAAAAKDALIASGENTPLNNDVFRFNRPFVEGIIARMTKDDEKARSAFTEARLEQEKLAQAQPNFGPPLVVLALIDAALGRKEEALRGGRNAVELLPVEKDSIKGPLMIAYLAMIAAWVGDKDLACEQLANALRYPSPLSYGELKLLPFWDPLRGDPRFEKIVASLAPK